MQQDAQMTMYRKYKCDSKMYGPTICKESIDRPAIPIAQRDCGFPIFTFYQSQTEKEERLTFETYPSC